MENLEKKRNPYKLNVAVFAPVVIIMVIIIAISFINQDAFATMIGGILTGEVVSTKWIVGPIILFLIIASAILCVHPIGHVRIGGTEAKPTYKRFSYWSMCVCSTIAIGIVFWGVAYPMTYYMTPYMNWGVEPGTPEAAVRAVAQTNLEWCGQYCLYMIFGIAMAVAIYNYGQPERTSSFLYLLKRKPVNNGVNILVDIICVFGIVAGVTCSLGVGTMQMSSGLNIIFGIDISKALWLIVIMGVIAGFILMSIGGIARGIKIVTDQNLRLYYIVMGAMIIIGPTLYILDMLFESTGYMLSNGIEMITYNGGINGDTLPIFWMIWLYVSAAAFAPIVGLFMAKISYGKKIKEMVIGGMLVPAIINLIWFSIFGGAAIHWQETGKFDIWGAISDLGLEAAMWKFFGNLPGGIFLWGIVFFIVIYLSFVTLAASSTTSAALTAMVATRKVSETEEPPVWVKVVWGAIMGISAYIFISYAGIDGAKSMALIGGMPSIILAGIAGICVYRIPKKDIAIFKRAAELEALEEVEEKIAGLEVKAK